MTENHNFTNNQYEPACGILSLLDIICIYFLFARKIVETRVFLVVITKLWKRKVVVDIKTLVDLLFHLPQENSDPYRRQSLIDLHCFLFSFT